MSARGRVVVAMDSFKGSLTAPEACAAAARGVRRIAGDDVVIDVAPVSDGGEGFASLLYASGLTDGVAVCDAASVVGLGNREGRAGLDVMRESSAPVATMLAEHVDAGARELLVGLGGTRTMDGGLGFAAACGVHVLDDSSARIDVEREGVGASLRRIASIEFEPAAWMRRVRLDERCSIRVACDVTNVLCGPQGAARTFGPQKGASPEQVKALDAGIHRFAGALEAAGLAPAGLRGTPGAGAAGGLGFALAAVLGAPLERGADVVADAIGLADRIAGAALVITGEGRLDGQTPAGKAAAGVAARAARAGVPCVAVVGRIGDGWERSTKVGGNASGFDAVVEAGEGLDDASAMAGAETLVELAASRAWTIGVDVDA